MVSYRLKRVNGKLYLVKEWVDTATGRKRTKGISRVEWLERLADECRAKLDKRPYLKGVAGPGGFEPPTTGLGGRRSILAELRAQLVPGEARRVCWLWRGVLGPYLACPRGVARRGLPGVWVVQLYLHPGHSLRGDWYPRVVRYYCIPHGL